MYLKKVSLHPEDESDVKIKSIMDEETEWFHSRVKCFPLYTLMLAVNKTDIDLLSLGCHGQELQVSYSISPCLYSFKYKNIKIFRYFKHSHSIK